MTETWVSPPPPTAPPYCFFNDTATPEIYTGEATLSLHAALP
eukprot:COSAG06_NODE_38564_length_422_cov_0.770898_2_plen_41_part_01